jgi:hypothetical protein
LTACKTINKDPWLLTLDETQKRYPITLFARDFGAIPDDGKDDAKALRDAVAAAKTKDQGVRIVLGKGKYDMLSADNGGAVPIAEAKNIMIEGDGALIVQHQMRTHFPVYKSENITFANLTFDADELPFAGAKVTAIGDRYFDCEVIPPHVVKEVRPKAVITFDPAHDAMGKRGVDDYQMDTKLVIQKLSETAMRVPLEKYAKLPEVGSTVIVRYEVYGPGVITLYFAKDVRVYNTTIHSHPGMGIYGSNTENILIDGLRVVSKTKDLFMSATADATHFNACRGRIDIRNSTFEKMGDDATNVHQMYWMLEEKQSPAKITVVWGKQKGHSQLPVDMLPRVGDTIGFGAQDNWLKLASFAKVKAVEPNTKDQKAVIVLESPLPDYVCKGMPMANMSSDPVLTISNCQVRGNRARGFLIKVSKATVTDCSFERTSLPAILFENDANYWFEGFRTQDISIFNCTFKDVNLWGANRDGVAILDAAAFSKGTPDKGPVNGTTRVENCTFTGCGPDPIMLKQTQTPIINGNVFKP